MVSPPVIPSLVALVAVVSAALLIGGEVGVGMVLPLSALPLFLLMGRLPEFFGLTAKEMGNPLTIVPICSAVGFAYVLKLTECDVHLVQLLVKPIRAVRGLLIPGGVA